MGRPPLGVQILFLALMVAVIVAVDLLFFRGRSWSWERLLANVGIVLVAAALYFRLVRRP